MVNLIFHFKLISKSNEKFRNIAGKYFVSKKNRLFEKEVKRAAKKQIHGTPFEGDISVKIIAWFKDKRHGDATNLFKSVNDALQGIAYHNDRQIKKATIEVDDDCRHEFFQVEIDFIRGKTSNR